MSPFYGKGGLIRQVPTLWIVLKTWGASVGCSNPRSSEWAAISDANGSHAAGRR